jgi:hypothetical protein
MTRWEQNGEMERDSERERAGAGGKAAGGARGQQVVAPRLPLTLGQRQVYSRAFRRKQMPPYRLLTSSADLVGPRLLLATRYSLLDICPSLQDDQETENREVV